MAKPLGTMNPTDGLALVSRPISEDWFEGKTPEEIHWQVQTRQFWKFQFEQQLAYQGGDALALTKALTACSTLHRQLPPWLMQAVLRALLQHVPDATKRRLNQFEIHQARWQAVRTCRALQPGSRRPLAWDRCWPAAADLLTNTVAAGSDETIRASYKLINAAGGENATPESCAAVRRRKE